MVINAATRRVRFAPSSADVTLEIRAKCVESVGGGRKEGSYRFQRRRRIGIWVDLQLSIHRIGAAGHEKNKNS